MKKIVTKQSQLRRLGVQDLHIIRAGFYRHAISLGMLRNAELASHHKRSMSELGVGPMQIGPVNVLSARYDITVKADPATMDDRIMRHEVLAVTPGRPVALNVRPSPSGSLAWIVSDTLSPAMLFCAPGEVTAGA